MGTVAARRLRGYRGTARETLRAAFSCGCFESATAFRRARLNPTVTRRQRLAGDTQRHLGCFSSLRHCGNLAAFLASHLMSHQVGERPAEARKGLLQNLR
jgi:hypothetical protein